MKKKIAITGGIGSGKSTAAKIIQELGFPIYSCDEIYKEIIQSPEYIKQIKQKFPICVNQGTIDRAKLSEIVFNNPIRRKELDNIAHPLIMQKLNESMESTAEDIVFAEVPLLFEGGFASAFDYIIIILRSIENRIQSIVARDNLPIEAINKRIHAQFDYSKENIDKLSKKFPIIIIENEENVESLKTNIKQSLQKLQAL